MAKLLLISHEEYQRLQNKPPSWLWIIVGINIGINIVTIILVLYLTSKIESFAQWLAGVF